MFHLIFTYYNIEKKSKKQSILIEQEVKPFKKRDEKKLFRAPKISVQHIKDKLYDQFEDDEDESIDLEDYAEEDGEHEEEGEEEDSEYQPS